MGARALWAACLTLLLAACSSAAPGIGVDLSAEPAPEPLQLPASDEAIANPERGFFAPVDLPSSTDFALLRAGTGSTLIHSYVRLDAYREADLPQSLLDALDGSFAALRSGGVKVILRFAYNFGPYPDSEPDASQAQILRHIQQLKPLLQRNADIIAWMEAGFVGAWGEWHTSTNGLDQNPAAKRAIVAALLDALPPTRMIQLRYPPDIMALHATPLAAEQAFSGEQQARIGHHNDCFLASEDDWGTYSRNGSNEIVSQQAYLGELTRFTPMSGETCNYNPPRSDCPSALAEMEKLHLSALNQAYHKRVILGWKRKGCLAEIERRMGYRLVLQDVAFSRRLKPGGVLQLRAGVRNEGFAALVNQRPLMLVLDGPARHVVELDVDVRRWEPGQAAALSANVRLPGALEPGQYRVALWLPDAAEALRANAAYAVQLANSGTWDAASGQNVLGTLAVAPDAPGAADPRAPELKVLR